MRYSLLAALLLSSTAHATVLQFRTDNFIDNWEGSWELQPGTITIQDGFTGEINSDNKHVIEAFDFGLSFDGEPVNIASGHPNAFVDGTLHFDGEKLVVPDLEPLPFDHPDWRPSDRLSFGLGDGTTFFSWAGRGYGGHINAEPAAFAGAPYAPYTTQLHYLFFEEVHIASLIVEPTDLDGNGVTNGADLLHWQAEGMAPSYLAGWESSYSPAGITAVPEPGAVALLLIGLSTIRLRG